VQLAGKARSALVSLEIFIVLTAVAASALLALRNPQLIQGRTR
jgi:hypothetical protein